MTERTETSTDTGTEINTETEPRESVEPRTAARREALAAVDLERALEALLMIAEEPLSAVSLATAVDRPVRLVRKAIEALIADYDGANAGVRRGFELREIGGGWRLYVRAELDPLVVDFVHTQSSAKLSQAALETLAVIAYKQPIARGQVAQIRAVNVDSVVRTLLARGLITETAQDPVTGAVLYGTTDSLLSQLGLTSLDELPPIAPLLDDGLEGFTDEPL